jgi:Glycosyl transferase family 2
VAVTSVRETPTLSVVVPATDRPAALARCVPAIDPQLGPDDELIVVAEPAAAGPAAARNAGAARARGEVLVFVDADVVLHPDVLDRIRGTLAPSQPLDATFGSYDDRPEAPGAVSGFRNLLHHHVHHAAEGPAATFWAGLGAIRRDAFDAVNGFDAARFPSPSVEDIDLGMRLAAAGRRIVLDPTIQGTHLKRWTLAEMASTDLARRGVPWVELALAPGAPRNVLNLGWRHRLSSVAVLLTGTCLAARRPRAAAAAALIFVVLNRSLYALVLQRRGPFEAAAAVPLHALHHVTAAAAVPIGVIARLRRGRSAAVARNLGSRRSR